MINSLSALPLFICTSGGFLFQVTWFYNSAGQLDYILENQGAGSCSGGPWQMQYCLVNPNIADGSQPTLASADLNNTFSTYRIPTTVDPRAAEVIEAVSLVNTNTTNTKSFNPNNIHATWAKSFALANSQSVYFMKLQANPTISNTLNFQVWSTKSQVAQIKLISATTGLVVWSSNLELNEARNNKSISLSTSISGPHVLQIVSNSNTLSANVIIN